MLTSILFTAVALLPGVDTPRDDLPPETIYQIDVELAVALSPEICDGYWAVVDAVDPAMLMPIEGANFSMLDYATLAMFEEAFDGRLTDAGRQFLVDWLHSC